MAAGVHRSRMRARLRAQAARSAHALTIGIDVGGTKVAAGVVDGRGNVLARARRPTPGTDPAAVEDVIAELVLTLAARHRVVAVGIGAAGFVDAGRAVVRFSPHLAWRDEPLRDAVVERTGMPVVVDNDANAAAWAEWRFGAGRGHRRLVCLTLGTGIGGGIVIDGRVERGWHGMAGEFGHMVLVPGGRRCECGGRGCWEQYASGTLLGREVRELAAAGSPVVQPMLQRVDGDPTRLEGPVVTAAARDGDPMAVDLLAEVGEWLGVGLANLAAALDPGAFVVGGGVSEAGELLLGPARASFRRTLTGRGHRPEPAVLQALAGPDAGLVGSADLARGMALRQLRAEERELLRRARQVPGPRGR